MYTSLSRLKTTTINTKAPLYWPTKGQWCGKRLHVRAYFLWAWYSPRHHLLSTLVPSRGQICAYYIVLKSFYVFDLLIFNFSKSFLRNALVWHRRSNIFRQNLDRRIREMYKINFNISFASVIFWEILGQNSVAMHVTSILFVVYSGVPSVVGQSLIGLSHLFTTWNSYATAICIHTFLDSGPLLQQNSTHTWKYPYMIELESCLIHKENAHCSRFVLHCCVLVSTNYTHFLQGHPIDIGQIIRVCVDCVQSCAAVYIHSHISRCNLTLTLTLTWD